MKSILALLLLTLSAFGADVNYSFVSPTNAPMALRRMELKPLYPYGTNSTAIVTSDTLTFTNNSGGELVVSNVVVGYSYRVTLYGYYNNPTIFTNSFDSSVDGYVNARDYITTNAISATALSAYDYRYVLLPTNNATATDGQVISKTGNKTKYVTASGGFDVNIFAGNNVTVDQNGSDWTVNADVGLADVAVKLDTLNGFGTNTLLKYGNAPIQQVIAQTDNIEVTFKIDNDATPGFLIFGGDLRFLTAGTGPIGSGSGLTTLNASSLSSGTVPSARGGAGTVSGIMKANGSGTVSAATSGTDYAPATSGSSPLKANGSGGFSAATFADIQALATTLVTNGITVTLTYSNASVTFWNNGVSTVVSSNQVFAAILNASQSVQIGGNAYLTNRSIGGNQSIEAKKSSDSSVAPIYGDTVGGARFTFDTGTAAHTAHAQIAPTFSGIQGGGGLYVGNSTAAVTTNLSARWVRSEGGVIIASNAWTIIPTLAEGETLYSSSNGIPHVSYRFGGTTTTIRLVP